MNENENELLERDDEIMRERGMIGGSVKTSRWELRPSSAREVSWMLTGQIIQNDRMDEYFRMCAFVYIHTARPSEIVSAIITAERFAEAVYEWMADHNPTRLEIEAMMPTYKQRVGEWFSSNSDLTEGGTSSGN